MLVTTMVLASTKLEVLNASAHQVSLDRDARETLMSAFQTLAPFPGRKTVFSLSMIITAIASLVLWVGIVTPK